MKKLKKLFVVGVALMMIYSSVSNVMAQDISIIVNGSELVSDSKPLIKDGRTMVPLRSIGEAVGCKVIWDNDTKCAYLIKNEVVVQMQIGNRSINISVLENNSLTATHTKRMDVSPEIINDTTYIPLSGLSSLGFAVGWNEDIKTAYIHDDSQMIEKKKEYSAALSDNEIYPTELRLSKNNVTIKCGETVVITAEVLPANATIYKNIHWWYSDTNIDVVDVVAADDGSYITVTGKKPGNLKARAFVGDMGGNFVIDTDVDITVID